MRNLTPISQAPDIQHFSTYTTLPVRYNSGHRVCSLAAHLQKGELGGGGCVCTYCWEGIKTVGSSLQGNQRKRGHATFPGPPAPAAMPLPLQPQQPSSCGEQQVPLKTVGRKDRHWAQASEKIKSNWICTGGKRRELLGFFLAWFPGEHRGCASWLPPWVITREPNPQPSPMLQGLPKGCSPPALGQPSPQAAVNHRVWVFVWG